METVKLATGAEIDVTMCVCDPVANILYIRIPNTTFSEVSKIFEDPKNTARIEYGLELYENFTHLAQIKDENGGLRVNLEAIK